MNKKRETGLDDKALVERSLAGNSDAFAMVIANTQVLVSQIVFKMIASGEDRKDAVQEIYLKVYQHMPTFRFQSKLSTWIARIAYNTCTNRLRNSGSITSFNPVDDDHDSPIHGVHHHPAIDQAVFTKQLRSILATEVEKLEPVYKTLITLYHTEELSYHEISEIMDLPVGTVKSYLHRARKILKENLLRNYKKDAL